jgi:predicted metalloprotease with PDZ domain
VPGARSPEPTPWAYVVRGGSPAAHFFINQRRPIREFHDDWTAVHELSHLLLPYVGSEDAWVSEGVATYYQNILRARGGSMTALEAWERLHAGFQRGMDSAHGMTLAQATENMYRGGTHMRVYWEGAAMILIADVKLRQITAGKQSMDTALAALNECCSSTERAWSGRELFDKLDEITGTTVLRELYDQHVASKDFPDLTQAYRSLGITARGAGIELAPEGREKQLRDAIMETGALEISEAPDR